ncbi:HAD family hydrolase [Devosia algicola]|uniref:HAD family hydrolase n=1 Tax=Devosia algicola TaxID=3026418 RepID=A0ABY7YR94_9HYPH|nr:HAD family hydrolase [Devosia algicola]WDR03717.1 HAD family hydrolase [Devosia algicola]
MTRAIIFDIDGVLVHGYHANPALRRRWDENLLADLGIDPNRFRDEFIFDIFIKKVVTGQMALVEALDKRLPSLGYNGSPMTLVHYWFSHDSQLNHELIAAIRALKAKADIRLFIATNQDHMRALWLWDKLGLGDIFEDIFYSARVGIRKPENGFFDFIAARIGPQSVPPLFFDDTPKVVEAASAYGWDAIEYQALTDFTNHPWVASQLAIA